MPVTKTAKRALRSSKIKKTINSLISKNLEVAIRLAKRNKTIENITKAVSLADRAAKKRVIHKNRAARIKSQLSKLLGKKSGSQTAQKTRKAKKPSGPKKSK